MPIIISACWPNRTAWCRPSPNASCPAGTSPAMTATKTVPRRLSMFPPQSERSIELGRRVAEFMEKHVYPAEAVYKRQLDEAKDRWDVPPVMDELKGKARAAGLWNMFLPKKHYPDSLSNFEYASLCEI